MSTTVRERPIIMSAESVRAILDGRKSQTRRVIQRHVWDEDENGDRRRYATRPGSWADGREYTPDEVLTRWSCPYGKPGDRLWVRETWIYRGSMWTASEDTERHSVEYADGTERTARLPLWWRTGGQRSSPRQRDQRDGETDFEYDEYLRSFFRVRRSPIHMPRWASRLTLEITDVRVERVQDISDADAIAEGVAGAWLPAGELPGWAHPDGTNYTGPSMAFRDGWNTLNAKRGAGWDANPWVWCITFRRVTR